MSLDDYSKNDKALYLAGVQAERECIIKLLDSGEHVWQLDTKQRLFGFSWKQKCRCGFYGVFNEHLITLIKQGSQKDNETVSLLTEGETK